MGLQKKGFTEALFAEVALSGFTPLELKWPEQQVELHHRQNCTYEIPVACSLEKKTEKWNDAHHHAHKQQHIGTQQPWQERKESSRKQVQKANNSQAQGQQQKQQVLKMHLVCMQGAGLPINPLLQQALTWRQSRLQQPIRF